MADIRLLACGWVGFTNKRRKILGSMLINGSPVEHMPSLEYPYSLLRLHALFSCHQISFSQSDSDHSSEKRKGEMRSYHLPPFGEVFYANDNSRASRHRCGNFFSMESNERLLTPLSGREIMIICF